MIRCDSAFACSISFPSTSTTMSLSPGTIMPSSDVPPHQLGRGRHTIIRGHEPNSTPGETSDSSPRRSHPFSRREDHTVPSMPADESRAPPAGCIRDRVALIEDPPILHDTASAMSYLPQVRCVGLSGGGPVPQTQIRRCPRAGVSRLLGKAPGMAWDGLGQDHPRVMSSIEEDAPRRLRAHCASTCAAPGASIAPSDAGVEKRIAAPPVSRGVYREQPPTITFASPTMRATMGHRLGGVTGREGRSGRFTSFEPGRTKVGGEAQARSVQDLASAPLGPRSSMGPSQGVGQVNQVQRLVDYGTYEGVCHGSCPPQRPCNY